MSEILNKKAIISLAVLQTNYDNKLIDGVRIGYIENFVLLCINLVKQNNYKTIELENVEEFKNEFTKMYGLNIPIMVMNVILTRAKKLGMFYQEERSLLPNKEKIDNQLPTTTTPKESIRKINTLHKGAKEYILNTYNRDYKIEEIEVALLKLLSKHNIELIYLAEDDSNLLPIVDKNDNSELLDLDYMLYKFILDIEENNYTLFQIFEDLCVGYMILNSIVYANDNSVEGKLKDISLFLDTSIVLRLLGFEGETHKKKYEELILYIKNNSNSISLNMFDKHFDELINILEKAKTNIEENKKTYISNVTKFFIENNSTVSDIQKNINSIETKLEALSINIFTNYGYQSSGNEYQIDEVQLKEGILKQYQYHNNQISYSKEFAIETDVVIISQIKRLQQGKIARNFSSIKNILLTDNIALSLAVKDYEKSSQYLTTSFIPTCVTDFFFFSQLWLHSNHIIENSKDVKGIIANTILTFETDKKLRKQFHEKIKQLKDSDEISQKEYTLLSSSYITDSILEEKTYGNYKNIDNKLHLEILEEIDLKAEEKFIQEQESHNNTRDKLNETEEELNKIKNGLANKKESCLSKISTFITMIIVVVFIIAALTSLVQHPNTPWWVNTILIVSAVMGFSIFSVTALKKRIKDISSKYFCKYTI